MGVQHCREEAIQFLSLLITFPSVGLTPTGGVKFRGVLWGVCWWMSLNSHWGFLVSAVWVEVWRFPWFVGQTGTPDLNCLFLKLLSFDCRFF